MQEDIVVINGRNNNVIRKTTWNTYKSIGESIPPLLKHHRVSMTLQHGSDLAQSHRANKRAKRQRAYVKILITD